MPDLNCGNVLYYLIVERIEKVSKMINDLTTSKLKDKVFVQVYDYFDNSEIVPELKYMKIYSKEIEKLNVLKQYCKDRNLRIVGMSTSSLSNHLLKNSDYAVTFFDNSSVKSFVDIAIKGQSYDKMFKQISKMYYQKKYSKLESKVDINE